MKWTKKMRRKKEQPLSPENKSTVCKPSSVFDDYLSTTVVTNGLQRICRDTEQVFGLISCTEWGLHERKVAIAFVVSYTTFPPLLFSKRFISVALSLKSPSQGVTLHSCSVVLGLSSWAKAPAIIWLSLS